MADNEFFTTGTSKSFNGYYGAYDSLESRKDYDFVCSGNNNPCMAYIHFTNVTPPTTTAIPYMLIGRGKASGIINGNYKRGTGHNLNYEFSKTFNPSINLIGENLSLNQFTSNGSNDFYNTSGDNAELVYPIGFGQKDDFNFSTNLPIFSNTEDGYNAFRKYLETGDYSGAENANELKYGNLYLDIYIDGTTRPNITVGLTCDKNTESEDNPYYGLITVDVYFANVIKDDVIKKPVTIGQSFNFSFDSVVSSADLEWYDKITYNVNKLFDDCGVTITGYVYSNNDDSGAIAHGSGSVSYKSHTSTNYEHDLIVRFHSDGENAENDGYTNQNTESENTNGENTIDTVGLLTTTYILTTERLKNVANKLWDSSFIDNIQLVNNNPIENVCSVKMLPVKVSGVEQEIYIGNVGFGINGEKISSNYSPYYSEKKTISLKSDIPVWANYAPFTKLSIYLPYIGYKDLDVNRFMGKSLQVKYIVDVLTGMCKAVIYNDVGKVISFDGNCGVDIPLTASNKAKQDLAFMQSVVGGVASLANKDFSGFTNSVMGAVSNPFSSQTSGCNTPTCSSNEGNVIALYIDYPHIQYPSTFAKENGLPCNLSLVLKNCKGYTKVASDNIDLSGIPCLDEEKERIRNILTSGFIANW